MKKDTHIMMIELKLEWLFIIQIKIKNILIYEMIGRRNVLKNMTLKKINIIGIISKRIIIKVIHYWQYIKLLK